MNLIYSILFPEKPKGKSFSLMLLALRFLFGLLLMSHGIQKWAEFESLSTVFPDPLGIGSVFSLTLAIFAELFCSIFFIVGFFYRLVMIPMMITLGITFFVIHNGSITLGGELAFIYLTIFIILYVTGPGKFSIDYFISQSIAHNNRVLAK